MTPEDRAWLDGCGVFHPHQQTTNAIRAALEEIDRLKADYEAKRKWAWDLLVDADRFRRRAETAEAERDALRKENERLEKVEAAARSDDGCMGDGYRLFQERNKLQIDLATARSWARAWKRSASMRRVDAYAERADLAASEARVRQLEGALRKLQSSVCASWCAKHETLSTSHHPDCDAARDVLLGRAPKPTDAPKEHSRRDGTPCPYEAGDTCNKCGWVRPGASATPPENPLRAENERLREALRAVMPYAEKSEDAGADPENALKQARAALKGTP